MKIIAMTGASGFVGRKLTKHLEKDGWIIVPLGRDCFKGNNERLFEKINGADVVINLAGAPILSKWTVEYKKILRQSRIALTKKLIETIALSEKQPRLFISTSAIGYYSNKGVHTENKYEKDKGFLGDLAEAWEREAQKASEIGIRTVIFRFGVVLGKNGGAIDKMILPFKFGVGGQIGDGMQPFSWIHITDLLKAYSTVINDKSYSGVYNLTSPNPTTNKGLTKALGKVLSRPTFCRIPPFILNLKFGEGAQLLTSGQNVYPQRLLDSGFTFSFPELEDAVRNSV